MAMMTEFSVFLQIFAASLRQIGPRDPGLAMLRQSGIERATIGMLAWVGLVYTIKFLWSPVVDRLRLPLLHLRPAQLLQRPLHKATAWRVWPCQQLPNFWLTTTCLPVLLRVLAKTAA